MSFWTELEAPELFPANVPPDGQYDCECLEIRDDTIGHGGFASTDRNKYLLHFKITSGPETNKRVFDFFDDSDHGVRRVVQIANDLGLDLAAIPASWVFTDVLNWFVGKSFTLNVSAYRTPYFQDCARVEFDGYVARL